MSNVSTSIDANTDLSSSFFGRFALLISQWGKLLIDSVMAIGDFSLFAGRMFSWMFTRMPKSETIWPNFHRVGVSSLPVVALTGTFIGMVLAVQSYFQFRQLGFGDTTWCRDQCHTDSRAGPGPGGNHACGSGWQRNGRRIGYDARYRAD